MNSVLHCQCYGMRTGTCVPAPGQTGDPCRPGWGYGDTNHDHGGPPGQGKGAAGGNTGKPHR